MLDSIVPAMFSVWYIPHNLATKNLSVSQNQRSYQNLNALLTMCCQTIHPEYIHPKNQYIYIPKINYDMLLQALNEYWKEDVSCFCQHALPLYHTWVDVNKQVFSVAHLICSSFKECLVSCVQEVEDEKFWETFKPPQWWTPFYHARQYSIH